MACFTNHRPTVDSKACLYSSLIDRSIIAYDKRPLHMIRTVIGDLRKNINKEKFVENKNLMYIKNFIVVLVSFLLKVKSFIESLATELGHMYHRYFYCTVCT